MRRTLKQKNPFDLDLDLDLGLKLEPPARKRGIGKFAKRTGVQFLNFATEGVDFATGLAARHIDKLAPLLPGLPIKPLKNIPAIKEKKKQWVDFLNKNWEKSPTRRLKRAVDKIEEMDFMLPSEEWQKASLEERFTTRLPETMFELGPSIVASIGTFALATPIGGSAILASSVSNNVRDEAMEYGLDSDRADALAVSVGVLTAALERIVPSRIFAGSLGVKNRFVGSFSKRLADSVILESGTEMTQEEIQMIAQSTFREIGFDERKERLAMAGLGGAMGGGGMQAIATFVEGVRDKTIKAPVIGLTIEDVGENMRRGRPIDPSVDPAEQIVPGRVIPKVGPVLPRELAGAKPRYGYRDKLFTLDFKSDADKALYIVAQEKKSKADIQYMSFLRGVFPDLTEAELRTKGRAIRNSIKELARDSEMGELVIEASEISAKAVKPEIKPISKELEPVVARKRGIFSDEEIKRSTDVSDFAEGEPRTITLYQKSKFSDKGGYVDFPIIRRMDNITLYQGGGRMNYWSPNRNYAARFGDVKEKTGTFYQIDTGNQMTSVFVEAKTKDQLIDTHQAKGMPEVKPVVDPRREVAPEIALEPVIRPVEPVRTPERVIPGRAIPKELEVLVDRTKGAKIIFESPTYKGRFIEGEFVKDIGDGMSVVKTKMPGFADFERKVKSEKIYTQAIKGREVEPEAPAKPAERAKLEQRQLELDEKLEEEFEGDIEAEQKEMEEFIETEIDIVLRAEFEKEANLIKRKTTRQLFADIKDLGGIKSYRDKFMADELRVVPLHLRNNKTGAVLDEMVESLNNKGYDFDSDTDLLNMIADVRDASGYDVREKGVRPEKKISVKTLKDFSKKTPIKTAKVSQRLLNKLHRLKHPKILAIDKAIRRAIERGKLDPKQGELPYKELKKRERIRQDTLLNINRYKADTEKIIEILKRKFLTQDDINGIVLEDGTKLVDTVKIKRNRDKSLATLITKKEISDIRKNYTEKISAKWRKVNSIRKAKEGAIALAEGFELSAVWFERKGLKEIIYDEVMDSGRAAEYQYTMFKERFKEAGLFKEGLLTKEGGWVTPPRFNLSRKEAENIAKFYLERQGKYDKKIELTDKENEFVEIFDQIKEEIKPDFYRVAQKMGKTPGVIENYSPLMVTGELEISDEAGARHWIMRKHPAFMSLKERQKYVPFEMYELDYRKVAAVWLQGITEFVNYGEATQKIKYLIESEQFKEIVTKRDQRSIENWLRNITDPAMPETKTGEVGLGITKMLRFMTATSALGLSYANVLKQGLTLISTTIVGGSPPKFKSDYAKAFGIDVKLMPSITKRKGDIAYADFQQGIGRVFMGPSVMADRKMAQLAMNGLLDKNYKEFLKLEVDITPEVQALIERRASDALDMWFGGFFNGQRPIFFRHHVGNLILMFTYPLNSQLNGFYRNIFIEHKKWDKKRAYSVAKVLAAVTTIGYMERVIENLSFVWDDEEEMVKDVLLSISGNIPIIGKFTWATVNNAPLTVTPIISGIERMRKEFIEGTKTNEWDGFWFATAETLGLPRTIRRIAEGMEIIEEGGVRDRDGKMLAPVSETNEIIRSVLRGRWGSIAAKDWSRNIGVPADQRKWFTPEVEFLQTGDYNRKAELYLLFTPQERKELRQFLSKGQQKKLDNALERGLELDLDLDLDL